MKIISKHFTYEELTHTNSGLLNIPNAQQLANLQLLVTNVLDPLRELYGHPITVNNGFRSLAVNKVVKGVKTSDHMKGMAADIEGFDNALLYKLIRDHFQFRQLIWEYGNSKQPEWVHVAYNVNDNKKQLLKTK